MIDWEFEDKIIVIGKDGAATERVYYKYKDWQKWEYTGNKEHGTGISHFNSPFLSANADNERAALLKTLEECDRIRQVYSDLADEIKELLKMEGSDK